MDILNSQLNDLLNPRVVFYALLSFSNQLICSHVQSGPGVENYDLRIFSARKPRDDLLIEAPSRAPLETLKRLRAPREQWGSWRSPDDGWKTSPRTEFARLNQLCNSDRCRDTHKLWVRLAEPITRVKGSELRVLVVR